MRGHAIVLCQDIDVAGDGKRGSRDHNLGGKRLDRPDHQRCDSDEGRVQYELGEGQPDRGRQPFGCFSRKARANGKQGTGRRGGAEDAEEFIDWLRERFQVIILSDTFYEFSQPLMLQLKWPTLFCHRLITDDEGRVVDYKLRQEDPKRASVKAFHSLNYRVIAAGDSYNDTTMLGEADVGILIHAPQNVIDEFPQFRSVGNHAELKQAFVEASIRDLAI